MTNPPEPRAQPPQPRGARREDGPPVGAAQRVQRARGSIRRQLPKAEDLRRSIDSPTMRDVLLPASVTGPEVASDAQVLRVLDLALRVGEVQLATGAGAAVAHDTMLAIASSYGLPVCDVDIAYSTITMCCHRGREAGPVTTMRNVRYRTQDYTRLAAVDETIKSIVDRKDPISVDEAFTQLSAAVDSRHPYPRFVAGLARSAFAAAVGFLLGGGIGVALVTFVLTGTIWGLARWLGRKHVPVFFQQVVGAAVVTTTATVLGPTRLVENSPVVVAAGLVVLLSGMSLVGLVQDAISGFPLTSAGRLVEVALSSAGLLVGVVLPLRVISTIGGPTVASYASTVSALTPDLVWYQLVSAALAGMFFALSSYAPLKSLPWAALAGALAWAVYAVLSYVGAGGVVAAALAAAVMGLAAMSVPGRIGLPPLVLVVAGITPLLPGLTLYRGFSELAGDAVSAGAGQILVALAFSLALAAGVSLGEQVGWPMQKLGRRLLGLERPFRPVPTGDSPPGRQAIERRPRVF